MDRDIQKLSSKYSVRRLDERNVEQIFQLCSKNEQFYHFHPPFVTRGSILEDLTALPPGKERKDKFYLGFFEKDMLAAVMDLIVDYPQEGTVYIGFFMAEVSWQGRGNGSRLMEECVQYFTQRGYEKLRLAIDRGNPQSEAFWTKNHFVKTGEEILNDFSAYLPMEKILINLR